MVFTRTRLIRGQRDRVCWWLPRAGREESTRAASNNLKTSGSAAAAITSSSTKRRGSSRRSRPWLESARRSVPLAAVHEPGSLSSGSTTARTFVESLSPVRRPQQIASQRTRNVSADSVGRAGPPPWTPALAPTIRLPPTRSVQSRTPRPRCTGRQSPPPAPPACPPDEAESGRRRWP